MSPESRRIAGILLVVLPTVMIGGVSLLSFLIRDPSYMANQLRQDLWRAGHAHAGVLLVLSLLALRYVDDTSLSPRAKWFVRLSIPSSAIFLPAAFFLSIKAIEEFAYPIWNHGQARVVMEACLSTHPASFPFRED
jgi:hypothetical protein